MKGPTVEQVEMWWLMPLVMVVIAGVIYYNVYYRAKRPRRQPLA